MDETADTTDMGKKKVEIIYSLDKLLSYRYACILLWPQYIM